MSVGTQLYLLVFLSQIKVVPKRNSAVFAVVASSGLKSTKSCAYRRLHPNSLDVSYLRSTKGADVDSSDTCFADTKMKAGDQCKHAIRCEAYAALGKLYPGVLERVLWCRPSVRGQAEGFAPRLIRVSKPRVCRLRTIPRAAPPFAIRKEMSVFHFGNATNKFTHGSIPSYVILA
jgi:hypothetical protein